MASKNRYTVVVSSCDSYEDLWNPFFTILKAEWPELEQRRIPIVLNTESKTYQYDGLEICALQLYKPSDNPSWTERLRRTLEHIDTEYVLMMLDDFFMQERVRSEKIDECVKWMDENHRIVKFCYVVNRDSVNIRDNRYEGYERRPLIGKYKLSCQCALWRKKALIQYLKKDENPWEWEAFGNWRTYRHPEHQFYSLLPDAESVFTNFVEINGEEIRIGGCIRYGRWFLPLADKALKKHGISIDYSIRGTISAEELIEPKKPDKKKEDAPRWKQALWFARPVYIGAKNVCSKAGYMIQHIGHFF